MLKSRCSPGSVNFESESIYLGKQGTGPGGFANWVRAAERNRARARLTIAALEFGLMLSIVCDTVLVCLRSVDFSASSSGCFSMITSHRIFM